MHPSPIFNKPKGPTDYLMSGFKSLWLMKNSGQPCIVLLIGFLEILIQGH